MSTLDIHRAVRTSIARGEYRQAGWCTCLCGYVYSEALGVRRGNIEGWTPYHSEAPEYLAALESIVAAAPWPELSRVMGAGSSGGISADRLAGRVSMLAEQGDGDRDRALQLLDRAIEREERLLREARAETLLAEDHGAEWESLPEAPELVPA